MFFIMLISEDRVAPESRFIRVAVASLPSYADCSSAEESMKKISLGTTKSKYCGAYYAFVDDEDFEWLSRYNWRPSIIKKSIYACRRRLANESGPAGRLMHRELLSHYGLLKSNMQVDHIDGNGLNNQKLNIRNCTQSQNNHNCKKRKPQRPTTSKYKGVSWNKERNKWRAYFEIKGKTFWIGRYVNEEDAARAYDRKALEMAGEFARTNFPRSDYE